MKLNILWRVRSYYISCALISNQSDITWMCLCFYIVWKLEFPTIFLFFFFPHPHVVTITQKLEARCQFKFCINWCRITFMHHLLMWRILLICESFIITYGVEQKPLIFHNTCKRSWKYKGTSSILSSYLKFKYPPVYALNLILFLLQNQIKGHMTSLTVISFSCLLKLFKLISCSLL